MYVCMYACMYVCSVSLAAPISLNTAQVPSSIPGVVADQLFVVGPGFPSRQAASTTPQGRPAPIVVPSFVSTFAMPIPALASSLAHSLRSVLLAAPISLNAAQVPSSIPGGYGSTVCCWPRILADSGKIGVSDRLRQVCGSV